MAQGAAAALARAGANVIIAGRNPTKGADAVARIRQSVPEAHVRFMALDLASLDSIAAFGESQRRSLDRVDVLINNAAVMALPTRQVTADGFELQFGSNHLGPFARGQAAIEPEPDPLALRAFIDLTDDAIRAGEAAFSPAALYWPIRDSRLDA